MAEEARITDETRKLVGVPWEPVVYEVEKGAIRRFADAAGDSNLLYRDEEYARKTCHGGIVAPPGFFGWMVKEITGPEQWLGKYKVTYKSAFNGGYETEFFRPVRPGDTIICYERLVDVYEKKGALGNMVFLVVEMTYMNQDGELVAKSRATAIVY